MKRKIIVLAGCVLLVAGCGKIPKLKNGEEAVVTFKDGNKISTTTLYESLKKEYGLQTLVTMIDKYVLENQFKNKVEECKEKADSTIKALTEQYGDEKTLLQAIQQYTNYQTIDAFKEYYYLTALQEEATKEFAKTLVKDKDIEKYYKNDVYGDVNVKHILIVPDVTDKMTDEEKKAAEEKAKETVNTIIAELKKTDKVEEKFTELAKKYSEDDDTKKDGGNLGYINYGTLSDAYDELIDAALKLKDGAYSTKVITTELGYHVIYRIDQKEKKSLKDAKSDIITTLSEKLLSEDATISGQALQHYRKELGLEIVDDDIQKQYASYVQSMLTPATEENTDKTNK